METKDKAAQLRKHKRLATGLFLLMVAIYSMSTWMLHHQPGGWVEYIMAFSEAAMVGALADWFAVTALFHHPLGIPVPHTNLIEKSKKNIGDNLGNFVTGNFLTPQSMRPYITKLRVSSYVADWLSSEKNKHLLLEQITTLLRDILRRIDDAAATDFITRKGAELLGNVRLSDITANTLQYFIEKGDHEQLITALATRIKGYISGNKPVVQEMVKKESYFFIPKFVDNKLAEKITTGLVHYFEEIENNHGHPLRAEITAQLTQLVTSIKTDPEWAAKFEEIRSGLFNSNNVQQYANDIWRLLKQTLLEELGHPASTIILYFSGAIHEFAADLKEDIRLQQKIDGWIRHTAYKYILKNRENVATLISNTVANWEGRELSNKLELEVGKDLQFIRINGTLVGGLIGLLIYTLTDLLSR